MTALTAMAFARYFSAGIMPVFAVNLAENVPTKTLFAAFGGLTTIMLPVPFVLFYFGERLRMRSGYSSSEPSKEPNGKTEEAEEDLEEDKVMDKEKEK